MATLLERLRAALAPDYEVERELASGGMGVVFLGRDVALGRHVAIKIIRPDRATANATERFVREAQILAALSHPNLVPVHRAGEAAGFSYYVMDFLEAETLGERLRRGPLPPAEAVAVARDVLAALEADPPRRHRPPRREAGQRLPARGSRRHRGLRRGEGHRRRRARPHRRRQGDGQPRLHGARADGGARGHAGHRSLRRGVDPLRIAHRPGVGVRHRSGPRRLDGRAAPPGGAAAPRPGMVRGRAVADGGGLSRRARARARGRARVLAWTVGPAVLVLLAVLLGRLAGVGAVHPHAAVLRLWVRPFAVPSAPLRWLRDSLPAALVREVGGAPDFTAAVAPDSGSTERGLVLDGTAEDLGQGVVRLTLRSEPGSAAYGPIAITASGPAQQWDRLADSLAHGLLLAIWSGQGGKLAADLPVHALPDSRAGMVAWMEAERLFAGAQWEAAYGAYRRAIAVDSTCLLCRLRLTDVARWLGLDQDSAETRPYRVALDSFPPHYRQLIEASFAPQNRRIALLHDATERAGDFGLAWFIEGDEIFHRGPLSGYSRRDAYGAMQRATVLWPDFAPAWEHLAWIAIGEGDSTVARRALDSLRRLSSGGDRFSAALHALLEVGYRWRFASEREAADFTDALLRSPDVAGYSDLGAGARYQLTFDAPRGAVYIGSRFEKLGRPDLETRGLLAELYGFIALGRLDSARAAAARLAARSSEPEIEIFLAELPAALAARGLRDRRGRAARAARGDPRARGLHARRPRRLRRATRGVAARAGRTPRGRRGGRGALPRPAGRRERSPLRRAARRRRRGRRGAPAVGPRAQRAAAGARLGVARGRSVLPRRCST